MRKILAVLLIIGGIAALATPYFTYTEKERVVDVGPIEIDTETEKTIPIPQIAAIAAIIIGIGMLAMGNNRSAV
jgi:multisubunit Na+/H+ antiporter MnhC subunit